MSDEDPRIEVVARAICEASGRTPDREVVIERLAISVKKAPQWHLFRLEAKQHIAAWDTLRRLSDS